MTKQLILLAGLHKTGTTSIQRTCAKHQSLLEKAGVTYPVYSYQRPGSPDRHNDQNHSTLLQYMFRRRSSGHLTGFNNSSPPVPEQLPQIQAVFSSLIERHNPSTLLMVAEAVSIFSKEQLLDLRNWFNTRGFGIRLLCCIRSPLSWLTSMTDQRVAGARGPHLTIRAAIEQFEQIAGIIRPRLANIASVFSDAEFYGFKSATSHQAGPVGYFLDKTGIELKEDVMPVRGNEGRSDHVVRIWSLINEEIRPPSNRNDARYISFLNSMPAGLRSVRGVKFTLRRDELAGLLPLLDEENDWLRANFGEEFCDEKIEPTNDRPSLDDQTRAQLQAIATTTEPRVRQIINKYLAAYD